MARKRYSDENCLNILRQVELDLASDGDVAKACRAAGGSDALRREVLKFEWFTTIRQAQTVINQLLKQFNHTRPQLALGMLRAFPETILENL